MDAFYGQAKQLVDSPDANKIFSFTADEHTRYGATTLGDSCVVARNLVAAHRGTRFVQNHICRLGPPHEHLRQDGQFALHADEAVRSRIWRPAGRSVDHAWR